jgi:hypothetical protein
MCCNVILSHTLTLYPTTLGYEGALAYACGLAAGLHLATTSPVAPHPVRVQLQAEELFAAMIHLPDDAWDAFHLVHLRM